MTLLLGLKCDTTARSLFIYVLCKNFPRNTIHSKHVVLYNSITTLALLLISGLLGRIGGQGGGGNSIWMENTYIIVTGLKEFI